MYKKLIALNMALIILFISSISVVFATSIPGGGGGTVAPGPSGDRVWVTKYIDIDGVTYEIGENISGAGWRLDEEGVLYLSGYVGGAISANYDLTIWTELNDNSSQDSVISAEPGKYGICVDGDLRIYNYCGSEIIINGGLNKAAIYVSGDLYLTYKIIASGGNCQALHASSITIASYAKLYRDEDEKYIETVAIEQLIEHEVILNGNGGVTSDGQSQYYIHTTVPVSSMFDLNAYTGSYISNGINYSTGVFNNNNKLLLGWKDSSGNFLNRNSIIVSPYEKSTELYAYWEDEENKAVILKNCYNSTLMGDKFIEPVKANEKYILPDMTRTGYIFDGWEAAGNLYKAGEEVLVEKTLIFTAQYRKNSGEPDTSNESDNHKLIINGKEYDARSRCGSRSLGWQYSPGSGLYSAQLDIWETYSGKPIIVPCSVNIGINGYVYGDKSNPAITVYGDAEISTSCNFLYERLPYLELCGFEEQPAIKATGEVYIHGINEPHESFVIIGGNIDTPAIVAPKISFYNECFYAGTKYTDLNITTYYTDAHILKLTPGYRRYSVTVSNGTVAPPTPQHNNYMFVGWQLINSQGTASKKWYMPGDIIDDESDITTLQAKYINSARTTSAIVLHGNGGVTEENSKYFITLTSTHKLSLYNIPQDSFTKDGYKFNGFNSSPSGDGTQYSYSDHLTDDGTSYVYNLYAQWKEADPYNETNYKLFVDGIELPAEASLYELNGEYLAPVRALMDSLGLKVDYDDATKTIIANKDDLIIVMQVDNDTMFLNSTPIKMGIPAMEVNGRTFLPIKDVAKCLGYRYTIDKNNSTIRINSEQFSIYSIDDYKKLLATKAATIKLNYKNTMYNSVIVYIGFYNSGNGLIYVEQYPRNVDIGTGEITIDLPQQDDRKDVSKVKIFVWDDNLTPLSYKITVDNNGYKFF